MNELELLQARLVIMEKRLRKLEVCFETRTALTDDEREAQRVAERLGFQCSIIFLPKRAGLTKSSERAIAEQRREVARELHRSGRWSATRIARAFDCADRTVQRWLE